MRRRLAHLLIFVGAIASPIWAGPILSIVDLGTLPGGLTGAAINSKGQVAGYGIDANGNLQAFASSTGIITPASANSASAHGINGNGQVAGTINVGVTSQAVLWVNGAAQQLGGLGGADSFGLAVNDRGQAVGMATTTEGTGRAVLFSDGNVLDVAPPGSAWSSAYAINSSGAVAGYSMDPLMNYRAFIWTAGSGAVQLGAMGGSNSYASGVNDANQVVGHSTVASGFTHAFIWDGTLGFRDLGTLGGLNSYGYGINNSGSVVGYSNTAGGDPHAFVYISGILFDLNSLLKDAGGWTLTHAYAINDAGQITGVGTLDGVAHAFRLDPLATGGLNSAEGAVPEPGTFVLVLAGGGFAFVLRRRFGS